MEILQARTLVSLTLLFIFNIVIGEIILRIDPLGKRDNIHT